MGGEGSFRGVIPEIVFRDARITGVSGVSLGMLERAVAMAAEGKLTPVLQVVMPLEEAEQAFELVSSRAVLGRVALVPSL